MTEVKQNVAHNTTQLDEAENRMIITEELLETITAKLPGS